MIGHDDSTNPSPGSMPDGTPHAGNDGSAGAPGGAAANVLPPEQPPMDDAAGGPQAEDTDAPLPGEQPVESGTDPQVPTEDGDAAQRSQGHPS